MAGNLGKARKSWGRLQRILSREGATKQVSGNFFQGGDPARAPFWVGDVGGVAKNGSGAELLHPWGSATDYREAAAERVGCKMALSLTGGSHEGSGVHRRQDVYNQKAEHSRAIHCNIPILDTGWS